MLIIIIYSATGVRYILKFLFISSKQVTAVPLSALQIRKQAQANLIACQKCTAKQ